ncbi:MAG: hypothetical protein KAR79_06140 [Simkaniaceae bacterium]|nr:hypothetical protein [Simkaniaceae bacterium]
MAAFSPLDLTKQYFTHLSSNDIENMTALMDPNVICNTQVKETEQLLIGVEDLKKQHLAAQAFGITATSTNPVYTQDPNTPDSISLVFQTTITGQNFSVLQTIQFGAGKITSIQSIYEKPLTVDGFEIVN